MLKDFVRKIYCCDMPVHQLCHLVKHFEMMSYGLGGKLTLLIRLEKVPKDCLWLPLVLSQTFLKTKMQAKTLGLRLRPLAQEDQDWFTSIFQVLGIMTIYIHTDLRQFTKLLTYSAIGFENCRDIMLQTKSFATRLTPSLFNHWNDLRSRPFIKEYLSL